MAENRYTIAVDLGEREVVVVAGRMGESGGVEVCALAKRPTQGIRVGQIENVAQVNGALSSALAQIEKELDVEITHAYGAISGEGVRCVRHSESVMVEDMNFGVSHKDLIALNNLIKDVEPPVNDTILEVVAENYTVDNRGDVKDPVGTFGSTLSSTFNFTLCDRESLKRLNLAYMQAGITLKRCYAGGVVAAESILSQEEMEGGVAMVDIGKGVTNVAIYHMGALRHFASIPIAGAAIDSDLQSIMLQERDVEAVKIKEGCAMAEMAERGSVAVAGRTPRDKRNVPRYNIAVVIEQRLLDIITFVEREAEDKAGEGLPQYGVVLTGGGAKLNGIDELFRRQLGVDVRIAAPECDESLDDTEYATVMGILQRGIVIDNSPNEKGCTVSINEEEVTEREVVEEKKIAKKETAKQIELPIEEEEYEEESEESEGGVSSLWRRISEKMNSIFNANGDTKI